MDDLRLLEEIEAFAPNCVLIGEGEPADQRWTKNEFLRLCDIMHNGNGPHDFLIVYRDSAGGPKFAKAKTPQMNRRATWAWDTIIGRATNKVGLGFYPSNPQHRSRWGGMDFDAHDGDGVRAKQLAVAAFDHLRRSPTLRVVLATSGSAGWHLFAFSEAFHPIADWTLLLKKVAAAIGAELTSGCCEIFPDETRSGTFPRGIRAPGTWNPKTDALGLIVFDSMKPWLWREAKKGEILPGLQACQKSAAKSRWYKGGPTNWLEQFAITQSATRHLQLAALVHTVYRQVGRKVAQHLAQIQFEAANPRPNASLEEHLLEFAQLWAWTERKWFEDLLPDESARFMQLPSEIQRDLFRILRNFSRIADIDQRIDFHFSLEHVAQCLGVTFQYVSKLRQHFVKADIISPTAPAVSNSRAARFRWFAAA